MTGKFRASGIVLLILIATSFLSINNLNAQQNEADEASSKANQPVPFSLSTMTGDLVPPFPAVPELVPIKPAGPEELSLIENLSFEENVPVSSNDETSDECCVALAAMITGNLESDISLKAKTVMIETALKMVSRNANLKAEAAITKLKADHALEMARMQSQMMQMRSMGSAADQINRVAGPLSQVLQRGYQQSVAINQSNERLSQTLAQIGYQRLAEDAEVARANRQRIQLSTPASAASETDRYIMALTERLATMQNQLESLQHDDEYPSRVEPASYSQSLRPRRQPLEPLQSEYRTNTNRRYQMR